MDGWMDGEIDSIRRMDRFSAWLFARMDAAKWLVSLTECRCTAHAAVPAHTQCKPY